MILRYPYFRIPPYEKKCKNLCSWIPLQARLQLGPALLYCNICNPNVESPRSVRHDAVSIAIFRVWSMMVNVPMFHITQLLGIESPRNTWRWCETNPPKGTFTKPWNFYWFIPQFLVSKSPRVVWVLQPWVGHQHYVNVGKTLKAHSQFHSKIAALCKPFPVMAGLWPWF